MNRYGGEWMILPLCIATIILLPVFVNFLVSAGFLSFKLLLPLAIGFVLWKQNQN
jgi:hypothetical protein